MAIVDKYTFSKTEEVIEKARAGQPEAMVELGKRLYSGKNADKSYELARSWFEAAALKNNVEGMFEYASMLSSGIGGEEDQEKAAEFFLKAADAGHREAMFEIGAMYAEGRGIKKNYVKAMKYLRASRTMAANALLEEAAKWWKPAAEHGITEGEYEYGLCLVNGTGVEQNIEEGISWIYKAALKDHPRAVSAMGEIYEKGIGNISPDEGKSRFWKDKLKELLKNQENK